MRLIFAFGLSFQLPVILNLLAKVGAIDSKYLKSLNKIQAHKKVMKILEKELKNKIHALEIKIN